MKNLPRFIVFEGCDGSGQSTQVSLLAKQLEADGHKVLVTKEPTPNVIGGLIRGILTHVWKTSNTVLQLLYAADRGHHLEREIIPALEAGYIVISDRYFFSSFAFGSLNCPLEWLQSINAQFPEPGICLVMDVSPATSMKRIEESRFGTELFEEKQKLEKVSKTYRDLMEQYPQLHLINAERSREEIHADVLKVVRKQLSTD